MEVKEIEELARRADDEISASGSTDELERIRIHYLGRRDGAITLFLGRLKNLSLEEKRVIGPRLQELKDRVEKSIASKRLALRGEAGVPGVDITKPGKKPAFGHLHPLSIIEKEAREIFLSMNFSVVEGPELEDEEHNFDALNIPPDHPAREMWDTFWLPCNQKITNHKSQIPNKSQIKNPKFQKLLLRTHTSPVQVRYMETHTPPFQIISPGRIFRFESKDSSHEINFYQLEGLMVGRDVNLANLKFVVSSFFKKLFGTSSGKKIEFRFRPSYFPFVEPGMEVDVKMGKKWVEVMGAGMVHRKVFEAVKYSPNKWRGFAFGMGLDRLAMIKYSVPDVRLFYSGDARFARQF